MFPMLHSKFCGNQSTVTVEEILWSFAIYGLGGHLGHVTISVGFHFHVPGSLRTEFDSKMPSHVTILVGFHFHVPGSLRTEFDSKRPSSFREKKF